MTEKEQTARILRNRLLDEIRAYQRLFPVSITPPESTKKLLLLRMHRVIDKIQVAYDECDGMETFTENYPHLRPVVDKLGTFEIGESNQFSIEDLIELEREIPKVEAPAEEPQPKPAKKGWNPFRPK